MKIRHGELVSWEKDPAAWLTSKLTISYFPRWTYDLVLRRGIHRFHRSGDPADARRHIQSLFSRSNLKNATRADDVYERFSAYVLWHRGNSVVTCDSRPRLDLPIDRWTFCGEIGRVDLVASGYRAVLLGPFPEDWRQQLRMPLIQKAVAFRYRRPVPQVEIAVQELDGSGLELAAFSQADIAGAEARFSALATRMTALLAPVAPAGSQPLTGGP